MTYEMLSKKGKQIYDRFQKGYVTIQQLGRYYELGAINEDEYEFILNSHYYGVKGVDENAETV